MAIKPGRKQEIENTVKGVFEMARKQGLDPNTWVIKAIKEVAKKKGLQMSKEEIAYAESYLQILISASSAKAEPQDAEVVNDDAAGQAGTTAKTSGATVSAVEDIEEEEEVPQDNIFKLNLGDIGLGKGTLEINVSKIFKNLAEIPAEEYEDFGRKIGKTAADRLCNHARPALGKGMQLLGDFIAGKDVSKNQEVKDFQDLSKTIRRIFNF